MRRLTDLKESFEGDLVFEGGEISETIDSSEAAYQIVRTVLNTVPGEYAIFPTFGFDPGQFEGSKNNQKTGLNLSKAIKNAISDSTKFYFSEIDVESFPIGRHTIACRIIIKSVEGAYADFVSAYDTRNGRIKSLVMNDNNAEFNNTIIRTVPPTRQTIRKD